MPRPAGVRNHDFAAKRQALIDRLCDFTLETDLHRPSLRRFAQAADASEPTLRHYFKDRQGLVLEILQRFGERLAAAGPASVAASRAASRINLQLAGSLSGLRERAGIRAHAFGLIEGLADPVVGEAYLEHVLEPALMSMESRLNEEFAPQTCPRPALRAASLAALAPLMMLVLHQDLLGGKPRWAIDETCTLDQVCAGLTASLGAQPA